MRSQFPLTRLGGASAALVAALAMAPAATAADPAGPSFSREVRPLLTEKCVRCHGPDKAEAGLDLTSPAKAVARLESGGIAIVPGDAAASGLIGRVTSTDPDVRMPPGDEEPLSAAEVDLLRRWIAAGAPSETHWAFRPLVKPPVPTAADGAAAHPIDAFVRARLAAAGIAASPPADPATLLKRVHLDLVGLLPGPAETAAFVADPSAAAYAAVVDRLLASPHFGERWGRHWLDLARYADSDGYEKDRPRPDAYVYRDWVIDAFNTNMPFDEFTVRQLAGDLLPDATADAIVATAFNRQTLTNTEGGVDQEEFRVAAGMDRTDTVGSVWLGLTVGCAKCHTHKYDPIAHAEYFSLYAFFNEADETELRLPIERTTAAGLEPRIGPLRRAIAAREREIAADERRWEEQERGSLESTPNPPLEARPLAIAAVESDAGLAYARQDDGSWRVDPMPVVTVPNAPVPIAPVPTTAVPTNAAPTNAVPTNAVPTNAVPTTAVPTNAAPTNAVPTNAVPTNAVPTNAVPTNAVPTNAVPTNAVPTTAAPAVAATLPATQSLTCIVADPPADLTGLRLETLPDKRLPRGGAGLAPDGSFVITRIRAEIVAPDGTVLRDLPLQRPKADAEAKGFAAAGVIAAAADPAPGWGDALAIDKTHRIDLRTRSRVTLAPGERLRLRIKQQHAGGRLLGSFRLTGLVGDWTELHLPPEVVAALREYPEKRVFATRQRLFDHFAAGDAELVRLKGELDKELGRAPTMQVRLLAQSRLPRTTRRFERGDFLSPAETVAAGGPAVLPPLRGADAGPPTRLDLARWLVGPAMPLTPRVIANQWWCRLFGRGIVPSVGDFGTRGEPPSHPELLDWLAATYRDDLRWNTKAFLRLILLSETYRQASAHRPELTDIDPGNALLARQNRLRVEAEIVRDLALGAGGLLEPKVGGPSVFPPMSADVAALSYANNFTWKTSTGPDRYRRGMYTFFKRTVPHPTLMTFDCPDANLACVVRSVSNTPLQALVLLNEESFVEAAQALARSVIDGVGSSVSDGGASADANAIDRERLRSAVLRCLCRPPRDAELDRLAGLLAAARGHYAAQPEAARALVAGRGAKSAPEAETAAWIATLRVLLNLDEFITRE